MVYTRTGFIRSSHVDKHVSNREETRMEIRIKEKSTFDADTNTVRFNFALHSGYSYSALQGSGVQNCTPNI